MDFVVGNPTYSTDWQIVKHLFAVRLHTLIFYPNVSPSLSSCRHIVVLFSAF